VTIADLRLLIYAWVSVIALVLVCFMFYMRQEKRNARWREEDAAIYREVLQRAAAQELLKKGDDK
jgi:uncharacterized membrane protein